ncbi:MAG: substrate-binding domain-containing protein [Isosphaeraceae bacterium]
MSSTHSRRVPAFLLVASLLACACAGCGDTTPEAGGPSGKGSSSSSAGGSGPRLVFITNGNSDWWNAVEKGMTDGASKFGARVEMRRNEGDTAGQIRLLEDVLSLPDVKGVAISVMQQDSPGIADKMKALMKDGKVVIAVDSDGQPDTRRAYIGTVNREAGEVAGRAAKQLRPDGGKVVAFVGTSSAANAQDRRAGFFAGAGDKFRIDAQHDALEVFEDGVDKSKAQQNVQTAISKHPDATVYLGIWSYNAHYIAEEVNKFPELRKKATIVTFDLDELAVQDLAEGRIDVTVCQNPYEMGYRGVRLLKALIDDDKKTIDEMLPKGTDSINTGVRVVVPKMNSPVKGENVIDIDAMKKWLDEKGLKST